MQNIEFYLQKFKDFGLDQKKIKDKISKVVEEESGVEINEDEISIINGLLRINVSGSAKSEIFIKRKQIKEKLEKILEIL